MLAFLLALFDEDSFEFSCLRHSCCFLRTSASAIRIPCAFWWRQKHNSNLVIREWSNRRKHLPRRKSFQKYIDQG